MSLVDKLKRPTYTTTLPSSKNQVTYKPFVVKERRNFLIALEEKDENAIIGAIDTMISNCTFNEISIVDIPNVDAEYLFIAIRNKSVGEVMEVYHTCEECKTKNLIELNLEKVKVEGGNSDLTIQLDENLWVKMRYPTMIELARIPEEPTEDDVIQIITQNIVSVIDDEGVSSIGDFSYEEVVEFIEELTQEQLNKLEEFFDDIPKLVFEEPYTCRCGYTNLIRVEGIESFFV